MSNVEELHEKMITMRLGDLLIVCGQAVNMGFPDKKVDLMLEYVRIALAKRKLSKKETTNSP